MISKNYANSILNALTGRSTLTAPTTVYLGLCANEPNQETGALTDAKEPVGIQGYDRRNVTSFFAAAAQGKIATNDEIQFKTAQENYPDKINFWFLSTSISGGVAYLWGKIKDVLQDKVQVEGFANDAATGIYKSAMTADSLLGLKEGEEYIVYFDGKEYEEVATRYEKDGASYIGLGNAVAYGGSNDGKEFAILYNESTDGVDTVGHLTVYATAGVAVHEVAVYAVGITVKKATVPTFYKGELQVSIDAV